MKKIMKNFQSILLFIILVLLILSNTVYADTEWGFFKGFYSSNTSTMMDTNIILGQSGAESSSKAITERLLGILQVCGSVISVIALIIIGFRYMFSSIEEKASMKGVLIYYVIGAVLVFATSQLVGIAYKLINGIVIE